MFCVRSDMHSSLVFNHDQASGPTTCGDEWADKEVMKYLGAELVHTFGNNL